MCFIYSRYRRQDLISPLYDTASLPLLQLCRKQKRLKLFYSIIIDLVLVNKHRYLDKNTSRVTTNKHGRNGKKKESLTRNVLDTSFSCRQRALPGIAFGACGRLEVISLISWRSVAPQAVCCVTIISLLLLFIAQLFLLCSCRCRAAQTAMVGRLYPLSESLNHPHPGPIRDR